MENKKTLKNIISSVGLQIVTIICGFIVPKLIISTYGSNVNGLVTSITNFLAFITLLESGFGPVVKSVLYKAIAKKDDLKIKNILKASERFFRRLSYIFIVYLILLCCVLPNVLSDEFDFIFTSSLIIIIAINTFAEYFWGMTYSLFLQANQKKYIIFRIQILTLVLNTIFIIISIKLGASIQVVKLISTAIFIFRPILQNIYVRKKYNINLKDIDNSYKIKQKWEGLAQHIAYTVNTNTDVVILTICTNLAEVSVYSIYAVIVNSVRNIIQAFANGIDANFGNLIAKNDLKKLNLEFKKFFHFYLFISIICYIITAILIIPFITIYTKGVTDVNYIRPIFAIILILAKFIEVIKKPFNDLVLAKGDFKQTKLGAYIESISNILISLSLVWYFGLIGVAIGTLISTIIRTTEIIIYANKNILKKEKYEKSKYNNTDA